MKLNEVGGYFQDKERAEAAEWRALEAESRLAIAVKALKAISHRAPIGSDVCIWAEKALREIKGEK